MTRAIVFIAGAAALAAAGLGGFAVGRLTQPAGGAGAGGTGAGGPPPAALEKQVWTCSMHPQIRLPSAGSCPICEMPLVQTGGGGGTGGAGGRPSLQLSEHALAMASVETVPAERRVLSKGLRAVGRIEYNESSLATITARVDGYAERLFVNFTGVDIRAGDHLIEVYSPELLVAQQELLIALEGGVDGPLVDNATFKLQRLGLTREQVHAFIASRKATDHVTLYSPIDGTVIERMVIQNGAFRAGDVLYRIANLDTVWVYVDIYEFDLPWVRYGQKVRITAEAYPGRVFDGLVTFVQPILNQATRTIRVPVHIENADHALMPGMFVSAVIDAALGPRGTAAPTGVEGKYSCPMHPQVLQDEDGQCPICDMPLEQIPLESGGEDAAVAEAQVGHVCPMECEGKRVYAEPGRCPVCNMKLDPVTVAPSGPGLVSVPATAVLDSGTRKIVYVERSRGLFESREIVAGPRTGEYVPVLEGLSEGERVVTRGGFLIDSQFQITGHSSLFYPGGLHASMDHEHGAAAEENGADTGDGGDSGDSGDARPHAH